MQENKRQPRVGRRGVLQGIGVSALATSAVVFGSSSQASAHHLHYACCHLIYHPTSYSACRNAHNYTWYCQTSPTRGCGCCEKKNSSGDIIASAYYCERV
jgi:hypothetical protein